jgi:aldose sugar dehydrogenase
MKRFATTVMVLALAIACRDAHPQAAADRQAFRIVEVARGLTVPWSIAFAPDGRLLVTERPGRVRVIVDGKLQKQPLLTLSDVSSGGEEGLMGLALHPQFANNHLIYLSYAYGPRGDMKVKVVRYRETGTSLVEPKVIVDGIAAAKYHAGCRLAFGPDQKLYVTTGDATNGELAQRMDSLSGKILRLNFDGTIPADNPFRGSPIYSLGHRNPQGIAWQPGTRTLWSTEHGPSMFDGPAGGDEVNIIKAGANYGWPKIHHTQKADGMMSPLVEYTPTCAPASAAFYTGPIKDMQGDFFLGCLRGEKLQRIVIDDKVPDRVLRQEVVVSNLGRIREVAMGDDGALYFSTSNRDGRGSADKADDRIFKLVPK